MEDAFLDMTHILIFLKRTQNKFLKKTADILEILHGYNGWVRCFMLWL